jgi:hypothetical protein
VLRDNVAGEREQGIAAGLAWGPVADAEAAERPVEYRVLEELTPKRD